MMVCYGSIAEGHTELGNGLARRDILNLLRSRTRARVDNIGAHCRVREWRRNRVHG